MVDQDQPLLLVRLIILKRMKKIILLALVSIIIAKSTAQEWFPIGASWYYNQVILLEGETYRYFEVTGDTIVQGKYSKVIKGDCMCAIPGYSNILHQDGNLIYSFDHM